MENNNLTDTEIALQLAESNLLMAQEAKTQKVVFPVSEVRGDYSAWDKEHGKKVESATKILSRFLDFKKGTEKSKDGIDYIVVPIKIGQGNYVSLQE